MTNWVTTGASNAGRPWTPADCSPLLLVQRRAGWWFLHTEGVW
ncbi:hypothetical protein AB0B10_16225 [Micromonospora arborensis]